MGKVVSTNKNEPMQFLTFEDETGLVEATFFPEAFRKFHLMLDWDRPCIPRGLVEKSHGAGTPSVEELRRV